MNNKILQPGIGIHSLANIAGLNLQNSKDVNYDFQAFLEKLSYGGGAHQIIQVNDCETAADWTESNNGTFDLTAGATGKRVGTNNIILTNTAATDGTQYVQTKLIDESVLPKGNAILSTNQADWRDTRYLGFWIHAGTSGDYGTAAEALVTIVNNGVEQTQVAIAATIGDAHSYFQVDMGSSANDWDRDKVESVRVYSSNATPAEVLHIDDMVRYDLSVGRGPFYGSAFPIKNAVIAVQGNAIGWSVDGLILWTSAAAVTDLGPVFLGHGNATLTGTGKRNKWGIVPGMNMCLLRAGAATVAGEGLEFSSVELLAGVSTGVDEKAIGKGMEAAGESGDDIYVNLGVDTSFIS